MKSWKWILLGTLLAMLLAGGGIPLKASAPAADSPVTIAVFNPTGATQVTQLFATRLADLTGKTVCQVGLSLWEASRTFPLIADLLQKQYGAKIVGWDKLPQLIENKDVPGLEDAVKQAGCQAVVLGNAG
jgi:hypothetical protein